MDSIASGLRKAVYPLDKDKARGASLRVMEEACEDEVLVEKEFWP